MKLNISDPNSNEETELNNELLGVNICDGKQIIPLQSVTNDRNENPNLGSVPNNENDGNENHNLENVTDDGKEKSNLECMTNDGNENANLIYDDGRETINLQNTVSLNCQDRFLFVKYLINWA